MSEALVLIDIQNDYFKGGRNELYQPEQAAAQAKKVLSFFRRRHLPVMHVKHVSLSKEATFFLPETSGVEIYQEVYPQDGEDVIIKHTPDSFNQTILREKLEENHITDLVICGMMTHMCVDTTVRAAKRLGYQVTLLEDACATKELKWNGVSVSAETVHRSYMASLNGAFAKVMTTDQWLASIK